METIEHDFIGFFAGAGRNYGIDDLPMTIFGLLYIEPEMMTMEEIANYTGYSLASISNTMKFLESAGIILKTKRPGSKKIYFKADRNLATMNIAKLDAASQNLVQPAKMIFPELIKRYRKKAIDKVSKQKVKNMEAYYKQVLLFEDMFDKWRKDLENISKKCEKIVK